MDIKKSINKNVNQLVENHISTFESKYIPYLIGNEVIKIHVKLDVKIDSIEYKTDSKEPVIVDLVRELNSDYGMPKLSNMFTVKDMFYGTKSNPMLQIDDKYFFCMVGMPHQVTRLEHNNPLVACIIPHFPTHNLSDGDWVLIGDDYYDASSFALVYRDELYFWNFSQVEHEPIEDKFYHKLIFQ